MKDLNRRAAVAALAALLIAGGAQAQSKVVPLKKAFPYLDLYLKLPPQSRDRFALAYRFHEDGRPPSAPVKMFVVSGAQRTELPVAADGRVARLPSLAMLASKATVDVVKTGTAPLGITMEPEATVAPAAEMNAADVKAGIDQMTAAIRRAGPLVVLAPKINTAYFRGAGSGRVVLADGREVTLPATGGNPYFQPATHPNARTLRFARAPSRVTLGPAPKGK